MSQEKQPNYTNTFEHSLDDRNRLSIPSEWRVAHGPEDKFLAVQKEGPNGKFIQVLSPAVAAQMKVKLDGIGLFDDEGQSAKEEFYSTSQEVQFDKAGRILLKASLLEHAGITTDEGHPVLLRGGGSTFSIYSAAAWVASTTKVSVNHRKTLSERGI
jgi:MraZ protein